VNAQSDASVGAIDNLRMARIARLAGAPQVSGAGVDLLRKVGDPVSAGQALYRIHARYPADLGFARDLAGRNCGYLLTPAKAGV
jgi:thymidine phosphorylase